MLGRSTIALRDDIGVSARLKALPSEVECVAQAGQRCVSDAFKLHARMELIRIVTFGKLPGNVHQRRWARRINQCSEVGIGLCRDSAQSLGAASNTAPRSTK